jgi:hypothetical protein
MNLFIIQQPEVRWSWRCIANALGGLLRANTTLPNVGAAMSITLKATIKLLHCILNGNFC